MKEGIFKQMPRTFFSQSSFGRQKHKRGLLLMIKILWASATLRRSSQGYQHYSESQKIVARVNIAASWHMSKLCHPKVSIRWFHPFPGGSGVTWFRLQTCKELTRVIYQFLFYLTWVRISRSHRNYPVHLLLWKARVCKLQVLREVVQQMQCSSWYSRFGRGEDGDWEKEELGGRRRG